MSINTQVKDSNHLAHVMCGLKRVSDVKRIQRADSTVRAHLPRVGIEKLLAIDLVAGDRLLAFGRDEGQSMKVWPRSFFTLGCFAGIHQEHAVLAKQPLLAFDQDGGRRQAA